jgi:hypothetical protein
MPVFHYANLFARSKDQVPANAAMWLVSGNVGTCLMRRRQGDKREFTIYDAAGSTTRFQNKKIWCFHKHSIISWFFLCWCNVLRWIWCLWCYSECISTPGKLEKYAWSRWASIPKVVGSIPTVFRHMFQACPVWIYTQSNITSIIVLYVLLPCKSTKNLQRNLSCKTKTVNNSWSQEYCQPRCHSQHNVKQALLRLSRGVT